MRWSDFRRLSYPFATFIYDAFCSGKFNAYRILSDSALLSRSNCE